MSDLIRRVAVLDAVKTECSMVIFDSYGNLTFTGKRIIEAIKRVPSVETEMEKGKWIKTYEKDDAEPRTLWKCSNCNEIERRQSDYCPNCGADMREVDNGRTD